MPTIQTDDPILLISEEGKRYLFHVQAEGMWASHRGHILFADLIGQPFGRVFSSHLGHKYLALRPTTSDLIRHLKRTTQIVFPKDAAQLVMELDLWSGKRLIEAGTGSGGLTLAFARAVMPGGKVYSYESRPEHQRLARANLARLGLLPHVELKLADIAGGFAEQEVDAVFLDVRDADQFVPQAEAALAESGLFGSLQPTAGQVSALIEALQRGNFVEIRVEELLLRPWKAVADRLRPNDRMIAHTGFLVFARKISAAHRHFWFDKRQRRRAVEYGHWTPTTADASDDSTDADD